MEGKKGSVDIGKGNNDEERKEVNPATMSLTLVAVKTTSPSNDRNTFVFALLSTSQSGQIDITPQSRFEKLEQQSISNIQMSANVAQPPHS